MKYLIILFTIFFAACSIPIKNTQLGKYEHANGEIKVHVATRGSYQYVLYSADGERYLSASPLPDALKQDGQKVIFSGVVLPEKAVIYRPSATDVPEQDFEVHKILLVNIEASK